MSQTLDIKILTEGAHINGKQVSLSPFEANLLVLMHAAKGEPVGKDELIQQAWEGRVVSPISLTVAIKKLRDTIKSAGGDESVITTVKGIGYAMVARNGLTITLFAEKDKPSLDIEGCYIQGDAADLSGTSIPKSNEQDAQSVAQNHAQPRRVNLLIVLGSICVLVLILLVSFGYYLSEALNIQTITCNNTDIISTSARPIQCQNMIVDTRQRTLFYSYNEKNLLIDCSNNDCRYKGLETYVKNTHIKK